MADQRINFGGTIEVTSSVNLIFFDHAPSDRRGSLKNNGAFRIYIGFNTDDVNTNEDAEDGKIWCEPGVAVRIPRECSFIAVKLDAEATVKAFYIED
jgi:hypothetical protein